jgi:Galactose oxidase, central domain
MKKKRTAQFGSFSLQLVLGSAAVCSMITGTLLAFFHPEAPAKTSQRVLTFAERAAYQRAIEEVYWRHRIWPKQNPDPKPSLDAVISQAQIEKKVEDYLLKSQTLEDHWQRPITAEQLQTEMDRMAQHTRHPEELLELFAALGSDPFIIAECLARPVLSDRLVTDLSAHDQEALTSRRALTENHMSRLMAATGANYTLPSISDGVECVDDTWTFTSTTKAPDGRAVHTAIWTGNEMIVWGGWNGFISVNTGGRYDPSTDSWTATTTTKAPTARTYHTAVWTGSEMIVWGGTGDSTGGKYNPGTDSWTSTSTINAPAFRADHTAVWTGSEMIIWGGECCCSPFCAYLNTGGRYNPTEDSWAATSTTNAPIARGYHTAVWTGSEMIVWGGYNGTVTNTGGRYDPSTNSWIATSTGPSARELHTAVWTGSEMIVWGGVGGGRLNTGGRYNPSTNSWIATTVTNAPTARFHHTAVWTRSEMIVWGGLAGGYSNSGGRYNPATDNWTPTSTTNAPAGREYHTAVWTGSEMIVWGGDHENELNTGGRYCAQSASPTPTATPTATATATASPTPTATATATLCHVTSPACGSVITGTAPTDFIINLSDAADPGTVDATDLTVNAIPADAFALLNGNTTIVFHFSITPVTQRLNTMHIPACAFNCGNGCVAEFTCTFTYKASTPTPTATVTPTATPTATPTSTARPSPTPRVAPTPRPRLTPPPRP